MHRAELTLAVSEVTECLCILHLLGMKPRRQDLTEILPEAPFTGAEVQDLTEILPEAPFTGAEVQDLTEILPPPRHKASSARFIGGSAKMLAL